MDKQLIRGIYQNPANKKEVIQSLQDTVYVIGGKWCSPGNPLEIDNINRSALEFG